MLTITCSAILFDLDGVLIDSTPAVARVWTQWAEEHGFNPAEVIQRAHGRPSLATIQEYLPHADPALENEKVEGREITDLDGVVPLPGALELLTALPANRWAIVTSCTRALAQVRIRAAGLPAPPYLVSASDIMKGKPDPEPFVKAAALLSFPAKDCIVVEDAVAGIRAGRAAGARVIAVRTTFADTELTLAGANWFVDNCASIKLTKATGNRMLTLTLP